MRVLVLAAVIVGVTGVSRTQTTQDPCTKEAVLQADSIWLDALTSRDVESLGSAYAPDAITAGSAMAKAKGLEAVKRMWTRLLSDSTFRLTWEARSAEVLEGCEVAYSSGRWRMQNSQRDTSGTYMAVWRRAAAGEWQVLIDGAWY